MKTNYKVLYRKYRPSTFDDVFGQDITIKILKDSISNEKISHAYIFSGPRGTGKTSTAKIFAKAINCLDIKDGNPCDKCNNCINNSQNSDIYEIDAASNNGVDQVREIIDNIKLAPLSSKYKVYIIDEVHMLSQSAFNALLLTLEEPPSHVVFILATTNVESVPVTILSRCQRLDFRRISDEVIAEQIKKISKKEKIKINDAAIKEITTYSDGALRDALSILDQMSKTTEEIKEEDILKSIGIVSKKEISEVIDALEENNMEKIHKFIEKLKSIAADYKGICKNLIKSIKEKALLIKQTGKFTRLEYDDYKNMAFEIAATIYKANVNIDSYDLLELILMGYVNLNEKEEKEPKKNIVTNVSIREKPSNKTVKYMEDLVNTRINNCFVTASKKYLCEAKEQWEQFVKTYNNKKIKAILNDSAIVLASDLLLIIKVDLQDIADEINDNIEEITKKFNDKYKSVLNFIAISNSRWDSEVSRYKSNIKNKIRYNMMEEPKRNLILIDDIFNDNVVEIK